MTKTKDGYEFPVSKLDTEESYPIFLHNVGGKDRDGEPVRIDRWTFSCRNVRDVVLDHIHGRVLNACAGKTKLEKRGCEIVRNDWNEEMDADYHYDVREVHEHFEAESFDCAILDPPFDPGRGEELYKGFHASGYIDARDAVGQLVRRGGTVIELGWNSWSLADKDGWERVEHHLYRTPFKGDVHLVVDRRVNQRRLTDPEQGLVSTDGGRNGCFVDTGLNQEDQP